MKKFVVLILLVFITNMNLLAKKTEGEIIIGEDTLKVIVKVPVKFFTNEVNYQSLQSGIVYFNEEGKRKKIRPKDADEFSFMYECEFVRMLSREKSFIGFYNQLSSNSKIFLLIEVDGNVKLFNYYYTQSSPGMYNRSTGMMTGGYSYQVEKYVLQKGEGELLRPKGLTFKKDMMEFFNDCPELVTKIQKKEFMKRDLRQIVSFYNRNCHVDDNEN